MLRAATYFWALSELFPGWHAVSAVVVHERRVGDIDHYGLLSLTTATDAQADLQRAPMRGGAIASTGDFTKYFENFTAALARVMRERVAFLGRITDNADYLPWQVTAPPDALEARVFEVIERLGAAGSAPIIAGLGTGVPPMRTLQRRLQKMVRERTIVKHGARKTATCSIADPNSSR